MLKRGFYYIVLFLIVISLSSCFGFDFFNLNSLVKFNSVKFSSGLFSPPLSSTNNDYKLTLKSHITVLNLGYTTTPVAAKVKAYIQEPQGDQEIAFPYSITKNSFKIKLVATYQKLTKTIIISVTRGVSGEAENSDEPSKLLISEVGASPHPQQARWFEVVNTGTTAINLADYTFRANSIRLGTQPPSGFAGAKDFNFSISPSDPEYSHYSVEVRSLQVPAGAYVVVQVKPLDSSFNEIHVPSGPKHYYVQPTGGYNFYWNANGFLELLKDNKTVDFVRWGNSTEIPNTQAQWGGGGGVLGASFPSSIGTSLARDISLTDTGNSTDWYSRRWATPGGKNDTTVLTDVTNGSDDQDGDGIPDECEQVGKTFAGMDLYSWGARIGQTDLFIHVDYMGGADVGMTPTKAALDKVAAAFAKETYTPFNYPPANLKVHFDCGNLFGSTVGNYNLDGKSHKVPESNSVFISYNNNYSSIPYLYQYKSRYFPIEKKNIFHYLLVGSTQESDGSDGSSGIAECPGNDFMITLKGWGLKNITVSQRNQLNNYQAATIMHEFGHNLGLHHGGPKEADSESDWGANYKPNYISIMNYLYQIQGLPDLTDTKMGDRYYYRNRGKYGVLNPSPIQNYNDLHHNCYSTEFKIDYSKGTQPDLDEKNLIEAKGLHNSTGDIPIDWNHDNDKTGSGLSYDLNWEEGSQYVAKKTVLKDHNDWAAIKPVFQRDFWSEAHGSNTRSILNSDETVQIDFFSNDFQEITQ